MSRLTRGQKILVTETEHAKLAAPELATVFEDYGTDFINVKLANGQLHCVRRSSIIDPGAKTRAVTPKQPRGPAKDVEAAVHAARLYHGSLDGTRIRDAQKLYERMVRKIDAVAKRRKIDRDSAYRQIADEARRRGAITPVPGKDI